MGAINYKEGIESIYYESIYVFIIIAVWNLPNIILIIMKREVFVLIETLNNALC